MFRLGHWVEREGLYRTVILFGLLIAAAWLFAVFSYYLSRKMGSDWFSRRARSWLWLERQSASQLLPARAREAEMVASSINSVLQRATTTSVQEIDKLITELQTLSNTLHSERARVQQE